MWHFLYNFAFNLKVQFCIHFKLKIVYFAKNGTRVELGRLLQPEMHYFEALSPIK